MSKLITIVQRLRCQRKLFGLGSKRLFHFLSAAPIGCRIWHRGDCIKREGEMVLNEREKAFADEYIINKGNAYQAALSAGYKEQTAKHAYQWLIDETQLNPTERKLPYKSELKVNIDERLKEIASEKVASAEEIMQYLTAVVRGEDSEETIVMRGVGVGMTEAERISKPPSTKDRLRAAETLAKIMGMYTNRVDITGALPVIIGGEDQLEN